MFHEELFTLSPCVCCQQDIKGLGVECSEPECVAKKIRLCVECFSCGAEVGPHKTDHKYRFFDSGSLGIYPNSNWSAREEIRLLDAIEQYGFGNWQDISKYIETKSPNESKDEYVTRFVQGTVGQVTWNNIKENVQRPSDITEADEGPLSPVLTQKLAPLEIQSEEAVQLGYMANRDDYEKEYDNEAEKLVSQLVFNADDEEIDIALKLALVDMYARRLRERVRRKRVIRDYQLVSQFFNKKEKPMSRRQFSVYEKDLQEKFKPFSQFHSAREQDSFINNLVREKELKFRLQECYKYRRNGITRADECVEYERMRSRKRTLQQNGAENGALAVIPEGSDRLENSIQPTQVMAAKPQTRPRTPTTTFAEKRSGDEASFPGRKRIALRSSCDDSNSSVEAFPSEGQSSPATVPQQRVLRSGAGAGQDSLPPQKVADSKATGAQFTSSINTLPSAHLLSHPEKTLCLSTHILPAQYLTIKTAILLKKPSKCNLGRPENLTDSEWTKIVNFMVKCGWMPSTAVSTASEVEN